MYTNCSLTPDVCASDTLAAQQTLDTARLICMKIVSPPVIILGTLANILNIVVLTRRSMRSSTNAYLTAVAVYDTAFLLNFQLITLKIHHPFEEIGAYMHLFPYLMAAGAVFSNSATWLTCAFTLERYVAVCHPMYGRKVCTREKAIVIILVVSAVVFFLSFPGFFQARIITSNHSDGNTTKIAYTVGTTEFSKFWSLHGFNYVDISWMILIPLIILLIFNSLLIRSIIIASRMRRQMLCGSTSATSGSSSNGGLVRDKRHRNQMEQQKTTRMLIIVVVFFCVLQLPSAASSVIQNLVFSDQIKMTLAGKMYISAMGNVVNLLLLFNAAMNFVLYSCFSIKFRNTFRTVILACCGRRDMEAHSRYTMISAAEGGGLQMTPRKQHVQPNIHRAQPKVNSGSPAARSLHSSSPDNRPGQMDVGVNGGSKPWLQATPM